MIDNRGLFLQLEECIDLASRKLGPYKIKAVNLAPQGMVLTYNGSSLEWIDPQPPRNTIHNAIKCDYCGSLHHDTRCHSCGAPANPRNMPYLHSRIEAPSYQ